MKKAIRASKAATVRRVRILGNVAVALPVVYLAVIILWRVASEYDAGLNLLGPAWLVSLGGEPVPLFLGLICIVCGITATALGVKHRLPQVPGKGLGACAAGLILSVAYVWITF